MRHQFATRIERGSSGFGGFELIFRNFIRLDLLNPLNPRSIAAFMSDQKGTFWESRFDESGSDHYYHKATW